MEEKGKGHGSLERVKDAQVKAPCKAEKESNMKPTNLQLNLLWREQLLS
ncbi:Hypothetical protein Minf_2284 [Methylacidiphilum infernorum V4]|uniref:Uncharacterized protein n=1 Tax=Methylacidiphilum infernorum (isolate V4) TaxID=481448 RepID=B3E0A9_METI4|nr:Hypothetical protein Minf_2284 [Methylacidiphilum infernorum V4]